MTAVRLVSGLGTLAGIALRDAASVLKTVTTAQIRTVAGLKAFFSGMTASAAPTGVAGYVAGGVDATATTLPATATPSGGIAPYTYEWTQVSGPSWTIDSPTAATTTFSNALNPGETSNAIFACTVTDATGYEAVTNTVSAVVSNIGTGF